VNRSMRGYTLVELAVVLILLGLVFGFAVPALRNLGGSQSVKGARDNIISQLQMARAKAIATGVDQPMHFFPGTFGFDYHLHPIGVGTATLGWNFPNGVSYGWATGTTFAVTMLKDGTANTSGVIPLVNTKGVRDTVAVLTSGLVLAQ